jgi:hypothetical protein
MKKNLELLGIPIFEEAYGESFGMKEHKLQLLMSRLDQVSPHVAYFLLKNCLFVPELTYFLRSSAIWKFLPLLDKIGSNLRSCLEYLLNIHLN